MRFFLSSISKKAEWIGILMVGFVLLGIRTSLNAMEVREDPYASSSTGPAPSLTLQQNQIIPAETQEISKPLVILFFENKQQNEDAQRLVKALIDQPRGGLLFVLGINEFSGHEQKTVSENVEFLQFTSKSDKPNGQNMVDTIKSAKEQNRPVIIVSGGDKGGGFTELTNGMKPDTLGRLKMYKNLKLPTGSIHSVILFDPKIGVTGTTGSEMTINFDVISNRVYNFYSRYGQVGKESKATEFAYRKFTPGQNGFGGDGSKIVNILCRMEDDQKHDADINLFEYALGLSGYYWKSLLVDNILKINIPAIIQKADQIFRINWDLVCVTGNVQEGSVYSGVQMPLLFVNRPVKSEKNIKEKKVVLSHEDQKYMHTTLNVDWSVTIEDPNLVDNVVDKISLEDTYEQKMIFPYFINQSGDIKSQTIREVINKRGEPWFTNYKSSLERSLSFKQKGEIKPNPDIAIGSEKSGERVKEPKVVNLFVSLETHDDNGAIATDLREIISDGYAVDETNGVLGIGVVTTTNVLRGLITWGDAILASKDDNWGIKIEKTSAKHFLEALENEWLIYEHSGFEILIPKGWEAFKNNLGFKAEVFEDQNKRTVENFHQGRLQAVLSVTRSAIGKLYPLRGEKSAIASLKEYCKKNVIQFRALFDTSKSDKGEMQPPKNIFLVGHGGELNLFNGEILRIIASLDVENYHKLLVTFNEIGASIVCVNSCESGGLNLVVAQQLAKFEHQDFKFHLINVATSDLFTVNVKSQCGFFKKLNQIYLSDDGKKNERRYIKEALSEISDYIDISNVPQANTLLKDLIQPRGSMIASVRWAGASSFFRAVDSKSSLVLTCLKVKELLLKNLIPAKMDQLVKPCLKLEKKQKYVQVYPVDLLAIELDLQSALPIFISKIAGSAIHFIGCVNISQLAAKRERNLFSIIHKCFLSPIDITDTTGSKIELYDMSEKAWFISRLEFDYNTDKKFHKIFKLQQEDTVENISAVINKGTWAWVEDKSVPPIFNIYFKIKIQKNAQPVFYKWMPKITPGEKTHTININNIKKLEYSEYESVIREIQTRISQSLDHESALSEATGGNETIDTEKECLTKFLSGE